MMFGLTTIGSIATAFGTIAILLSILIYIFILLKAKHGICHRNRCDHDSRIKFGKLVGIMFLISINVLFCFEKLCFQYKQLS